MKQPDEITRAEKMLDNLETQIVALEWAIDLLNRKPDAAKVPHLGTLNKLLEQTKWRRDNAETSLKIIRQRFEQRKLDGVHF